MSVPNLDDQEETVDFVINYMEYINTFGDGFQLNFYGESKSVLIRKKFCSRYEKD